MTPKPTAYWDYIRVEELLALQSGQDPDETKLENDEVLFIVVHQIDELWMKLALRDLVRVRDLFAEARVPEQALSSAVRGIRRMGTLFRKMGDHFELLETMTPRDFLDFRGKLYPASGFQSGQLREIELLMGLDAGERVPLGHEESWLRALRYPDGRDSSAYQRVKRRLDDRPTLLEAVNDWLYRTPIEGSTPGEAGDEEAVRGFVNRYLECHRRELLEHRGYAQTFAMTEADRGRLTKRYDDEMEAARAFLAAEDLPEAERARGARLRAALVFIESFRELPLLAWPREVLDGIIEMEQGLVIFRQRHARMVERIIGRRTGTGGSAGVDYLENTSRYRVFRDLWAVRTLMLRRAALPPLLHPEAYRLDVEK